MLPYTISKSSREVRAGNAFHSWVQRTLVILADRSWSKVGQELRDILSRTAFEGSLGYVRPCLHYSHLLLTFENV